MLSLIPINLKGSIEIFSEYVDGLNVRNFYYTGTCPSKPDQHIDSASRQSRKRKKLYMFQISSPFPSVILSMSFLIVGF